MKLLKVGSPIQCASLMNLPIVVLAIANLILVISLTSCATGRNDTQHIYTDLENQKKVAYLQKQIASAPSNGDLRFELVDIYLSEYFFDDAITQLREIIKNSPEDIQAYQFLALVLIKSEKTDYDGAVQTLTKALQIATNSAAVHAQLALVYSDMGNKSAAIQECETAVHVATDPKVAASAYLILSAIDREHASDDYQNALRCDPSIAADSSGVLTIPVYVGKISIFHVRDHPQWKYRLKQIDLEGSRTQ